MINSCQQKLSYFLIPTKGLIVIIKLTYRYAKVLFDYAQEKGLEKIYRQTVTFLEGDKFDMNDASKELQTFFAPLPVTKHEIIAILNVFKELAREDMNIIDVEIISAVPLSPEQLRKTEEKLVEISGKRLDITTTTDPSIIGGLRVIMGNTVLDNTIKRNLSDMKKMMSHKATSIYSN